ncbi:MAG: EAL domain-containing protein [Dehalococcoidia bacterium]
MSHRNQPTLRTRAATESSTLIRGFALWGTVAAAVPALGWSLFMVAASGAWRLLLPFVVLGIVAELLRVRIARARAETMSFSLSGTVTMAAVTSATPIAPLVALCAAIVHMGVVGTRRPDKLLFNLAVLVLATSAGSLIYTGTAGWVPGMPGTLLAGGLAVCAYVTVNLSLVAAIIALHSGQSFLALIRDARWYVPTNLLLGITGAFLGASYQELGVVGTAIFVLPILVARYTLAFYASRSEETIRMLEAQADRMEQLALYDTLTELPNRSRLHDKLEVALGAREAGDVALLLLDLDRFKEINDTFGHQPGDRLLQHVGPRLRTVLHAEDVVARLGGDEFAVLLAHAGVWEAREVAERAREALARPYPLEGYMIEVSASVGIAVAPDHGLDADVLMRRAEIAMYVAKSGRGVAVYEPAQEEQHSPERLALIGELRQAIEGDALTVHYQPKVDCATGDVFGAEALVRWQHERHGLIPPDRFIPIAEHTGLIRALTRRVLTTAITDAAGWAQNGAPLSVSVNLSMRDLEDSDLPDFVAGLLAERGLDAAVLEVEVTESTIMLDPQQVCAALDRFRAMGIAVAVDDFGTGYSALSYLKDLPVDELKIDRSFVQQMMTDLKTRAIVRSTVALGHALGLVVVAEGVEDEASRAFLASVGCDSAQGFYFSRPLPLAEFVAWVHARRQHGSAASVPPATKAPSAA